MSQTNGTFQIFIDASSADATYDGYRFPMQLSGNYRLKLINFQCHIYPDILTANTIPIEIYSPNFQFTHGSVGAAQYYHPIFLYPMDANNKFQGNADIELIANFGSDFILCLRNAITKALITDLVYAVFTFDFEKI